MDTAARPKDHGPLCTDASPGRADTAHQRLLLLRADHATSWDDVFAATMAVMYGYGGHPPAEGTAAGHRRHGPHGEHVEHVEHAEHAEPADRRGSRAPARTAAGPARAWPCRALRRAQRLFVARWSAVRGRRHGAPGPEPEPKQQPPAGPALQQDGPAAPRRPFWAGRGCM